VERSWGQQDGKGRSWGCNTGLECDSATGKELRQIPFQLSKKKKILPCFMCSKYFFPEIKIFISYEISIFIIRIIRQTHSEVHYFR
jgi:hypothetical protein